VDAGEYQHKPGRIGNRQITGIMDQCIETIGLRRMIGKVSPKIAIAIKPARACDSFGERADDPALGLLHFQSAAIVVRQRLVTQTIGSLAILPRLDDVPAGMPQYPRHVVVIVGSAPSHNLIGDERPHPSRQPFAFAPRQGGKKIVDPLLLRSEPSPQVLRKSLKRRGGQLTIQSIEFLQCPRDDPGVQEYSIGLEDLPNIDAINIKEALALHARISAAVESAPRYRVAGMADFARYSGRMQSLTISKTSI
jgi:hypothetical protein